MAPPATLYRAVGCAACNHSGYQGRMGIYELLEVDEPLRHMIHERASDQVIRDHCRILGLAIRSIKHASPAAEEFISITKEYLGI